MDTCIDICAKKVAKSFSSAASTYDKWAKPQEKISNKILDMIPKNIDPKKILDIGCGTGALIKRLAIIYKKTEITGIDIASGMIEQSKKNCFSLQNDKINFLNCNIEKYKCTKNYYDIITSCFSLQWLNNPLSVFKNIYEILNKKGVFIVSLPISGSLKNLISSYYETFNIPMKGLNFRTIEEYSDLLENAGFNYLTTSTEDVYEYFKDFDILKYFKLTGTNLIDQNGNTPLTISAVKKLIFVYKKKYSTADGYLPLNFKVLFVICKKGK